jgi:signal peptidase I
MEHGARDDLLARPSQAIAGDVGATDKPPTSRARNLIEWVVILGGALLAALLIKTFLFQAFYIPSGSMEPTLKIGDRVLVNKLSYQWSDIERGDLIVFARPDLPAGAEAAVKDLIKRVVGLPGETIEARDGEIYVDGRKISEPYLPSGSISDNLPPTEVPAGKVFVMGDNRGNSRDSRILGPIDLDSVHGRAFVRIWPVGELGLL